MDRVFSLAGKNIWVMGHRGLVGSALYRRLQRDKHALFISDFDLKNYDSVIEFIYKNKIDFIFMAAAKVGGIHANKTAPADFITENLNIQNAVIQAAHDCDVERLLFLGSSCIYPRDCAQPMREDMLLTGVLEPTNAAYAMAKLAGLEMIKSYRAQYGRRYISVLPTNLYGSHDNFHAMDAHVPAALLHRLHHAKINADPHVTIWGSGTPRREFMHADDVADACVFVMEHYDDDAPINIGSGEETSIADFAALIKDIVGYEGELIFDTSKPDGAPRKLLDCGKLGALGWRANIPLPDRLRDFYRWFLDNQNHLRGRTS